MTPERRLWRERHDPVYPFHASCQYMHSYGRGFYDTSMGRERVERAMREHMEQHHPGEPMPSWETEDCFCENKERSA